MSPFKYKKHVDQASLQSRIEARLREMGVWFESVHDSITIMPEDVEVVNLVVDAEMNNFIETMHEDN